MRSQKRRKRSEWRKRERKVAFGGRPQRPAVRARLRSAGATTGAVASGGRNCARGDQSVVCEPTAAAAAARRPPPARPAARNGRPAIGGSGGPLYRVRPRPSGTGTGPRAPRIESDRGGGGGGGGREWTPRGGGGLRALLARKWPLRAQPRGSSIEAAPAASRLRAGRSFGAQLFRFPAKRSLARRRLMATEERTFATTSERRRRRPPAAQLARRPLGSPSFARRALNSWPLGSQRCSLRQIHLWPALARRTNNLAAYLLAERPSSATRIAPELTGAERKPKPEALRPLRNRRATGPQAVANFFARPEPAARRRIRRRSRFGAKRPPTNNSSAPSLAQSRSNPSPAAARQDEIRAPKQTPDGRIERETTNNNNKWPAEMDWRRLLTARPCAAPARCPAPTCRHLGAAERSGAGPMSYPADLRSPGAPHGRGQATTS